MCAAERRARAFLAQLARSLLWALVIGGALWLVYLQADRLWLAERWQTLGHLVHRLTCYVTLPTKVIVGALWPPVDHHWTAGHHAAIFFGSGLWIAALAWYAPRRRARQRAAAAEGPPLSRRRFFGRAAAGAAGAVTGGVAVYAAALAPMRLRVRRYELALADLPAALDGLTVVQISDTHLGRYSPLSFIRGVVERTNALAPDLVLLTGDYIQGSARMIEPGIGVFAALAPKIATLAVLGNHDHWEGADACRAAFARARIPLIDNDRRFVSAGRRLLGREGRGGLCVAGLGDLWEDSVSIDRALGDVDPRTPRLLLSHNPDAAEGLDPGFRVDLMLSGHTHGGQVRLPGIGAPMVPSRYGQKYAGGLCRAPTCRVVVSRGIGVSVVPVRLGVPPEIPCLVLRHRERSTKV